MELQQAILFASNFKGHIRRRGWSENRYLYPVWPDGGFYDYRTSPPSYWDPTVEDVFAHDWGVILPDGAVVYKLPRPPRKTPLERAPVLLDRVQTTTAQVRCGRKWKDVARLAGVTPETISRALAGCRIQLSTARYIAAALGVELAEILAKGDSEDDPQP